MGKHGAASCCPSLPAVSWVVSIARSARAVRSGPLVTAAGGRAAQKQKSAPRLPLVHVTRTPIMKQEPLELGVCVKREPHEPGVCVLHEPLAKVHSEVWAEQLGKKQDDEYRQLRETCQTRVEEVCKKHDDEMEQLCQTHRQEVAQRERMHEEQQSAFVSEIMKLRRTLISQHGEELCERPGWIPPGAVRLPLR